MNTASIADLLDRYSGQDVWGLLESQGEVPAPNGCRSCGVDYQEHCQRYDSISGRHGWIQPPTVTILARMRLRRDRRKANR
jgi:hypothetical protein